MQKRLETLSEDLALSIRGSKSFEAEIREALPQVSCQRIPDFEKLDPNQLVVVDLRDFYEEMSSLLKLQQADAPAIFLVGEKFDSKIAKMFESGFVDFIDRPFSSLELGSRIRSLWVHRKTDLVRAKREEDLYEMTLLLRELNKELDRLSHYDALTNIPNRRLFLEVVEREWRRAAREKSSISILMIDIDHFKSFNDSFGHLEGDDLLQQIAVTLQDSMRRPADMLARWGGEEFVVVLPHTDRKGAQIVAESLRAAVENLQVDNKIDGKKVPVTVSVGVATAEAKAKDKFMDLIDKADSKLYEAKSNGRNRIAF